MPDATVYWYGNVKETFYNVGLSYIDNGVSYLNGKNGTVTFNTNYMEVSTKVSNGYSAATNVIDLTPFSKFKSYGYCYGNEKNYTNGFIGVRTQDETNIINIKLKNFLLTPSVIENDISAFNGNYSLMLLTYHLCNAVAYAIWIE